MPGPHVNVEWSCIHNSCIAVFEPVIPPANSLIAPLDLRSGLAFIGESLVPGTDDGFERRFDLLEHAGDGIAVAVEQPANQEAGNLDVAELAIGSMPEFTIALVFKREQGPGR